MVQDTRKEYIYSRAYELAASGHHLEPVTIVSTLITDGFPEAAELLDSPLLRNDLRQVCLRNWPGVPMVTGDDQAAAEPQQYASHQPGAD